MTDPRTPMAAPIRLRDTLAGFADRLGMPPAARAVLEDTLAYGKHSANLVTNPGPQLGRHNIDGHPDIAGQLSVDTLCGQHPTVVTDSTVRVRTEDDRKTDWYRRQYARQAEQLQRRALADADTVRIAAVTA